MRYRILSVVAAGVTLLASTASAQVCQGDLSFRSRTTHITGAFGMTENTTDFGGGMMFGHAQGLYGGGSLGIMSFDGLDGNSIVLGGGIGYQMPLVKRSVWQLCPGATLSLGFGPSVTNGATSEKYSSQTFTAGASIGRVLVVNKDFTLLPFGSAAIGHTSTSLSGAGSASDSYVLLGFGAGLQFSPTWVIKPSITVAAGADIIDDTVFGLSVSFALPR